MSRTTTVLVVTLTVLAAASYCCCSGFEWDWDGSLEPTWVFETPVPQPPPTLSRETPGKLGVETEELLETTAIPVRDLHELAIRLRGLPPDTPRTVNPAGSPDYPEGTRRLFHASNAITDEHFDVYAIQKKP